MVHARSRVSRFLEFFPLSKMSSQKAELIFLVACATYMMGVSGFQPAKFSYAWSESSDQVCNPPIKPNLTCMCWVYEAAGEPNYAEWFCNHQYPNGRPGQALASNQASMAQEQAQFSQIPTNTMQFPPLSSQILQTPPNPFNNAGRESPQGQQTSPGQQTPQDQ